MLKRKLLQQNITPSSSRKNCRICGKQGRKNEDCWEKEENKHKRPANWKRRSPSGQTSSNTSSTTKKFDGKCNYCQKIGQKEKECRKKIKEAANIAQE